ncbi:MAG TPA: hypothetical protein PLP42_19255 [Acidobacteriota bacterium]|nr:hypothetical protein [Acidobacteriota bacterium]
MASKRFTSLTLWILAAGISVLLVLSFLDVNPQAPTSGEDVRSLSARPESRRDSASPHVSGTGPDLLESAPRMESLKRNWSDEGGLAALADLGNANRRLRREVLHDFVATLDESSVYDLLARLNGLDSEDLRADLKQSLLERLAELNPPRAAMLVDELPDTNERADLMLHVARHWSGADLSTATEWAVELPEGTPKELTIRFLAENAMSEAPATAGQLIMTLPEGPVKSNLLDQLVREWSAEDFDAALAWAQSLPEGSDKARVLMRLG